MYIYNTDIYDIHMNIYSRKYRGFNIASFLSNDSIANLAEFMYERGWNLKGLNNEINIRLKNQKLEQKGKKK